MKPLNNLCKELNKRTEVRPFNEKGLRDGNWNYIHREDAHDLLEMAYKLGLKHKEV